LIRRRRPRRHARVAHGNVCVWVWVCWCARARLRRSSRTRPACVSCTASSRGFPLGGPGEQAPIPPRRPPPPKRCLLRTCTGRATYSRRHTRQTPTAVEAAVGFLVAVAGAAPTPPIPPRSTTAVWRIDVPPALRTPTANAAAAGAALGFPTPLLDSLRTFTTIGGWAAYSTCSHLGAGPSRRKQRPPTPPPTVAPWGLAAWKGRLREVVPEGR
jgi:hypothetical protein